MDKPYFICPTCLEPLQPEGRALKCRRGHSFDVAREGYVNLLTGKAPRALQGDSADMVHARRAFLRRGLYRPLTRALANLLAAPPIPRVIADFGCGEGYYLGDLIGNARFGGTRFFGTDISKPAVAAAARAHTGAIFAVADTNLLIPLPDASVDVGLCIFAPRNAREFDRVIRPGGRLIVVIPGPGHLLEVRERYGLMGIEDDKTTKIQRQLANFSLADMQNVDFSLDLPGSVLRELIGMTPNARHLTAETRQSIDDSAEVKSSVEFIILSFKH